VGEKGRDNGRINYKRRFNSGQRPLAAIFGIVKPASPPINYQGEIFAPAKPVPDRNFTFR